jgi:hypothetical protein
VAQRRTQPQDPATQVCGQPPLFNVSAHRACSSVRSSETRSDHLQLPSWLASQWGPEGQLR